MGLKLDVFLVDKQLLHPPAPLHRPSPQGGQPRAPRFSGHRSWFSLRMCEEECVVLICLSIE
jgi:hypothetical protein